MADLSGLERALRILNLEDSEVMILGVKLLKTSHVNLVLQLGDTKVLDLNWISDGPFKTNRYGRQVVGVLDQLKLSATVQSFTFKLDAQRFAIHDLEEDSKVMFTNFFRVVKHVQVHLLSWLQ